MVSRDHPALVGVSLCGDNDAGATGDALGRKAAALKRYLAASISWNA